MAGKQNDVHNLALVEQQFREQRDDSVLGMECRTFHFGMQLAEDLAGNRQRLRRLCPPTPGVYRWFDPNGRLLYVGKAKSLCSRLLTYFAANPSDEKMRRIREMGSRIVWEETALEFLALVREQELIAHCRPPLNAQGQPQRKRPAFLCISRHAAPNVYVSFDGTTNARTYFGPLLGSRHLREVADTLNHQFALRDCADKTSIDYGCQLTLFPDPREALCMRHEIGTCLGPCAARVTHTEYASAVKGVEDFLSGHDRSLLLRLEQEMARSAADHRFEKAAALRDRLRLLKWTDRKLEELRRTRYEYNCVLEVPWGSRKAWWVLMTQGAVSGVLLRPETKKTARAAQTQLESAQNLCLDPAGSTVSELLMQSVVNSWFRKNRDQRDWMISYAQAETWCSQVLERRRVSSTSKKKPNQRSTDVATEGSPGKKPPGDSTTASPRRA